MNISADISSLSQPFVPTCPLFPDGSDYSWSVEENRPGIGGLRKLERVDSGLYLNNQKIGLIGPVNKSLRELVCGWAGMIEVYQLPSASVLDFLLRQPQFVPDDWREKEIAFGGTIYRTSKFGGCRQVVRCLSCRGRWVGWTVRFVDEIDPALVYVACY